MTVGGGNVTKTSLQVIPYLWENHLLIFFDSKWVEVYNGIPKFSVFIDEDKKLHLVSVEEVKR